MASLNDKITLTNRAYAHAQDTFINNGVKIILEFLNENDIDELDFTEIKGISYKELYEITKVPYWENDKLEVATILKIENQRSGFNLIIDDGRDGDEWYYTDDTSYCDPEDIKHADANVLTSLLNLIEFLSTYYKVERKAVFVPKGE